MANTPTSASGSTGSGWSWNGWLAETERGIWILNQPVTIGIGFIVSLIAYWMVAGMVPYGIHPHTILTSEGKQTLVYFPGMNHAFGVIAAAIVFFSGIRLIPIASIGSVLFLQRRFKNLNLKEGYHWLPPILVSFALVNLKERVQELDKLEVFTLNRSTPERPEKIIGPRVTVKGSLSWRVKNPFLFLSIDESVIQVGLDDAFDELIRGTAIKSTMDDFLAKIIVLKNRFAKKATTLAEGWGIEVLRVFTPSFSPDKEVIVELNKVRAEEAQRDAEVVELRHVANLRTIVANAYTTLTDSEIIRVVQTERGKATRHIEERTYGLDEAMMKGIKELVAGYWRGQEGVQQ